MATGNGGSTGAGSAGNAASGSSAMTPGGPAAPPSILSHGVISPPMVKAIAHAESKLSPRGGVAIVHPPRSMTLQESVGVNSLRGPLTLLIPVAELSPRFLASVRDLLAVEPGLGIILVTHAKLSLINAPIVSGELVTEISADAPHTDLRPGRNREITF